MAKNKATFYIHDYVCDLIRDHGGSRFLEGMVILAHLGGFIEAAAQVSSSWNQKRCPDVDNYQLYPQSPEAWQKGVCGLRKAERDDAVEHAENLLNHVNPNFSKEENIEELAHYLRTWVL